MPVTGKELVQLDHLGAHAEELVQLADMELVLQGVLLPCHSHILAQRSGVWRGLLLAAREQLQQPEAGGRLRLEQGLVGKAPGEMTRFLRCLYTPRSARAALLEEEWGLPAGGGPPTVTFRWHLEAVAKLADEYDAPEVLEECVAALQEPLGAFLAKLDAARWLQVCERFAHVEAFRQQQAALAAALLAGLLESHAGDGPESDAAARPASGLPSSLEATGRELARPYADQAARKQAVQQLQAAAAQHAQQPQPGPVGAAQLAPEDESQPAVAAAEQQQEQQQQGAAGASQQWDPSRPAWAPLPDGSVRLTWLAPLPPAQQAQHAAEPPGGFGQLWLEGPLFDWDEGSDSDDGDHHAWWHGAHAAPEEAAAQPLWWEQAAEEVWDDLQQEDGEVAAAGGEAAGGSGELDWVQQFLAGGEGAGEGGPASPSPGLAGSGDEEAEVAAAPSSFGAGSSEGERAGSSSSSSGDEEAAQQAEAEDGQEEEGEEEPLHEWLAGDGSPGGEAGGLVGEEQLGSEGAPCGTAAPLGWSDEEQSPSAGEACSRPWDEGQSAWWGEQQAADSGGEEGDLAGPEAEAEAEAAAWEGGSAASDGSGGGGLCGYGSGGNSAWGGSEPGWQNGDEEEE